MALGLKLTALLSLALVASCRVPGTSLPHSEHGDRPGRGLTIVDVEMPELAWNTNVVRIVVENGDEVPHKLNLNVQYRNLSLSVGGVGWSTVHVIRPNETASIERDFMVRSLPGEVNVRVTVEDAGTQAVLHQEDFTSEFPLANNRINLLRRTPLHKSGKKAYPTLRMTERGPFVFYTLAGEAFAAKHLAELTARRERAYRSLVKQLNPDFGGRIAFFLFPDAKTKYAYTLCVGLRN